MSLSAEKWYYVDKVGSEKRRRHTKAAASRQKAAGCDFLRQERRSEVLSWNSNS